jgi:hypothetical protein
MENHVMSQEFARSATCAGLLFLCLMLSGCPGAEYLWEVRTASTTRPTSFNPAVFEQQPVAVLVALTPPPLHGHEVDLTLSLSRILKKIEPTWKLVSPQDAATRINQQGLAADYTRMRTDYERSDILDRDSLKKIGVALGARYVFQPRLAAFTQTLYERWEFPGVNVKVLRTRSSILRVSLQLWDSETGELIWASAAEAAFQEEALFDNPVYLQEAGLVTWGSIISDLTHNRTAFRYTPTDALLDSLTGPGNGDEASTSHKPAAVSGGK